MNDREVKKKARADKRRTPERIDVDNISADMLKASLAIALYQFLNICNQTLGQCKAPSDWKKSLLAKIPKKG